MYVFRNLDVYLIMSYLTAHDDDHGLIEFGCNSYGGLAIRDSHPAYEILNDENNVSNERGNSCDEDNEINVSSLFSAQRPPNYIKSLLFYILQLFF